jgi:hypothetical protein
MTKPRYLTKSRFKLAAECPTKLFYTGKETIYRNTQQGAVKVYERICRRQEIEFGRPVGPEDYVFMPHAGTRDSAIKSLAKQFDIVLALTGLKISNVGESRSLYSLRHSSIMFRLMFGRAVDTLALGIRPSEVAALGVGTE